MYSKQIVLINRQEFNGVSNPVLGSKKIGGHGIPWSDTDVRLVDIKDGVVDKGPKILEFCKELPKSVVEKILRAEEEAKSKKSGI